VHTTDFEAAYEKYADMLYRIALSDLGNTHDAEDAVQDTFVAYFSYKGSFETEEHRKAWLIRVTVNCCNSHFVAPWRKNVTSMEDVMLEQLTDEDEKFWREDGAPDVYARVMKLPEQMREVVLLFYYEDMSVREIADMIGTSEVNVKKRLSRARQKLRMELEEDESV
jgi:RNA polymerase sigma-70 factor (ECF subfamily)